MARWLFKEEPESYSFADLQRDGSATWSGVANALAQKNLRAVRAGDEVFFYHTGGEKAVVGVMRAAADPAPDPDDETGKRVVVTVEPVRALPRPVSLAALKGRPRFAEWELVRLPRLSVMPVPDDVWRAVEEMAAAG